MARLMISISGVRGIVGEGFDPVLVARWSAAFSTFLPAGRVVVGRDSRQTGELFARSATDVFVSTGRDVVDIGIVPTPTVQVAVESWNAAGGLILSASHNPAEWNAMKFVSPNGSFLPRDSFARLCEIVESGEASFQRHSNWGSALSRHQEAIETHIERIEQRIDRALVANRPPKLLLECVHGAGGVLLPTLLRRLGAEVEVLHEEPSGCFPKEPEPTGPVLEALAAEARRRNVDFALAVDPDADRCAVAIPGTDVVGEEWTLPLVALHLLRRRKGRLVTNLSSSTRLEAAAVANGSTVERTPVGEAHVVSRMREIDAVLGGEGNGGVIDPQIHLGRDAAVAAAWLVEAHAANPGGLAELASNLPPRYVRKGKSPVQSGEDEATVGQRLRPLLGEPDDRRDGLRWKKPDGFVHVRFSATEPVMRVVVESSTKEETERLFGRVLEHARIS